MRDCVDPFRGKFTISCIYLHFKLPKSGASSPLGGLYLAEGK